MVSQMQILPTLLLLSACMLVSAQTTRSEQDALALAIKSQRTLNEYAIGAMQPEAMKYAQRLRLTQAALDAQRKQWPAITQGPDSWDKFRACRSALEKASHLAGLSGLKAVSKINDKIFDRAKEELRKLRAECDGLIKQAGH